MGEVVLFSPGQLARVAHGEFLERTTAEAPEPTAAPLAHEACLLVLVRYAAHAVFVAARLNDDAGPVAGRTIDLGRHCWIMMPIDIDVKRKH